jgi:hypothetical protein
MKYFFILKINDGGRISLQTRIRQVCASEKLFFEQRWGHIPTNKFALIWVVIGDQELLSVRVMVDEK